MIHRFPKMLLNGIPYQIESIRTSKEKIDLKPGDAVEYRAARKLANIWHKAKVAAISLPDEIRLTKYNDNPNQT